jgi:hypothetical protein
MPVFGQGNQVLEIAQIHGSPRIDNFTPSIDLRYGLDGNNQWEQYKCAWVSSTGDEATRHRLSLPGNDNRALS